MGLGDLPTTIHLRDCVRIVIMVRIFPLISVCLLVCSLLLSACGAQQTTLTIFAATSLTDVQEEWARAFESANPGVSVRSNFASSSVLTNQLLEGAKADVFASANAIQMERLASADLLQEPARDFASNRVVLIVPAANHAAIASLDDLTQPGIRLILALPGTPIRTYTDELLERAAEDRNPQFLDKLYANLKSEEANVRLVLTKTVLGEADAAFVYQSDITADIADQVRILPIDSQYQAAIAYPIAILATTQQEALAADYIRFILSPAGQAILASWGLLSVNELDHQ